ncbi:MAG TPA: hypothetical protein VFG86_02835, partial [Chloroflexota bacterium]|nr:hypothetical protein [Chloroflexota bacterium]
MRLLRRSYTGALASSGVILLGKIFTRAFGGTLGSSGVLQRMRERVLATAGEVLPSGAVVLRQLARVFVQFDGWLYLRGEFRLSVRRAPQPPLQPTLEPLPTVALQPALAVSAAPPLVATGASVWPPLTP